MSAASTRSKWISETGPESLFAGKDAPLFGRRQRRARGPRLPVVAVTGFLGSGKTTLIRALLAKPEGANTAIVVNEFGEVGIDQALLRSSSDVTVLLGNGCLCCNVRTDLQETLRALFADRARGAVPSFARVIIETSGLADPGPVLQTFATDRALGREFHLQALVTIVDAVAGAGNIERMPEARKQVALADRIVVTKSDLTDATTTERLIERIAALTTAPVEIAANGAIEPSFVLDEPGSAPRSFDLERCRTHARAAELFADLRKAAVLAGLRADDGGADGVARPRSAARQGHYRGRRMPWAGRRSCRAARCPPAGRARGLARFRPALAPRLRHPRPAA